MIINSFLHTWNIRINHDIICTIIIIVYLHGWNVIIIAMKYSAVQNGSLRNEYI